MVTKFVCTTSWCALQPDLTSGLVYNKGMKVPVPWQRVVILVKDLMKCRHALNEGVKHDNLTNGNKVDILTNRQIWVFHRDRNNTSTFSELSNLFACQNAKHFSSLTYCLNMVGIPS